MTKKLQSGWWRCRIRSRRNPLAQKWVYFEVTIRGSDQEWRREARFLAGQYLHRQIFDVERIIYTPQNLTPIKNLNEVQYYFRDAIAAVPADLPLLDQRPSE